MKENVIGKRIRALRNEKDETCEELAKKMGLARSTVGHWEVGRRDPGIDEILWLAQYFGVSTAYLLGETDDRKCSVYHADIQGHDVAITYKPEEMDHEFTMADALKVIEKLRSIGVDVDAMLK